MRSGPKGTVAQGVPTCASDAHTQAPATLAITVAAAATTSAPPAAGLTGCGSTLSPKPYIMSFSSLSNWPRPSLATASGAGYGVTSRLSARRGRAGVVRVVGWVEGGGGCGLCW
jgi:hypothetical protein